MAYAFVPFSAWFTGFLNGTKHKEQGLPKSIVWSVIGTSSVMGMVRVLANAPTTMKNPSGIQVSVALFVVTPLYMGATYLLGDQIGQAIRYVEDTKKGVKISLV